QGPSVAPKSAIGYRYRVPPAPAHDCPQSPVVSGLQMAPHAFEATPSAVQPIKGPESPYIAKPTSSPAASK
ncbi:MAG TPA: hypothetical protein VEX18_01465, partial [Polyangiaceae bacterium]|nr:hypothetical protein [Polyangiaceae bacterium]